MIAKEDLALELRETYKVFTPAPRTEPITAGAAATHSPPAEDQQLALPDSLVHPSLGNSTSTILQTPTATPVRVSRSTAASGVGPIVTPWTAPSKSAGRPEVAGSSCTPTAPRFTASSARGKRRISNDLDLQKVESGTDSAFSRHELKQQLNFKIQQETDPIRKHGSSSTPEPQPLIAA